MGSMDLMSLSFFGWFGYRIGEDDPKRLGVPVLRQLLAYSASCGAYLSTGKIRISDAVVYSCSLVLLVHRKITKQYQSIAGLSVTFGAT